MTDQDDRIFEEKYKEALDPKDLLRQTIGRILANMTPRSMDIFVAQIDALELALPSLDKKYFENIENRKKELQSEKNVQSLSLIIKYGRGYCDKYIDELNRTYSIRFAKYKFNLLIKYLQSKGLWLERTATDGGV